MTYLSKAPLALVDILSSDKVLDYAIAITNLIAVHSKTILVGTGKSHHVANIVAKMANSFGLRWIAIDASHAMHGDMGIIGHKDIVIYLSKSGESIEILNCAKYLSEVTSVAITCDFDSSLERLTTFAYCLPVQEEYSLFGRAPMFTSIVQLMFLFEIINGCAFNKSDSLYLSAHPAGAIGARE